MHNNSAREGCSAVNKVYILAPRAIKDPERDFLCLLYAWKTFLWNHNNYHILMFFKVYFAVRLSGGIQPQTKSYHQAKHLLCY